MCRWLFKMCRTQINQSFFRQHLKADILLGKIWKRRKASEKKYLKTLHSTMHALLHKYKLSYFSPEVWRKKIKIKEYFNIEGCSTLDWLPVRRKEMFSWEGCVRTWQHLVYYVESEFTQETYLRKLIVKTSWQEKMKIARKVPMLSHTNLYKVTEVLFLTSFFPILVRVFQELWKAGRRRKECWQGASQSPACHQKALNFSWKEYILLYT